MEFEREVCRVLDCHLIEDVTELVVSYLELSLLPKWWWSGKLSRPLLPAYVGDNKIAVSSHKDHTITIYTTEGKFLRQWGEEGKRESDLYKPLGIAGLRPFEVAVCDSGNHRIQVFSLLPGEEGKFLRQWGSKGSDDGQFDGPEGIAFSEKRQEVVVTDTYNNRVQVFTPDGKYLRQWGRMGQRPGEFVYPKGVSVLPDGRVVVCDWLNHRIQIFTADGQFLRYLGGQYSTPSWIAASLDGRWIAITETDTHRMVVHSSKGGEFILCSKATSWSHQLRPIGIAALPSGGWVTIQKSLPQIAILESSLI